MACGIVHKSEFVVGTEQEKTTPHMQPDFLHPRLCPEGSVEDILRLFGSPPLFADVFHLLFGECRITAVALS